jgi:chorismate mutase-like protein
MSAAAARADGAAITGLIAERLALMEQVAAYKYLNGVSVEDPEREAVVIAHATERAAEAGLDSEAMAAFFAAQIEAAKAIQRCWIARWQVAPDTAPEEAPDLALEIRPRLIEIGNALTAAIADAKANGETATGPLPAIDCLPDEAGDAIMERLGAALALEAPG